MFSNGVCGKATTILRDAFPEFIGCDFVVKFGLYVCELQEDYVGLNGGCDRSCDVLSLISLIIARTAAPKEFLLSLVRASIIQLLVLLKE